MERKENRPKLNKAPHRATRGDRHTFLVQTAALLFVCAASSGYFFIDRTQLTSAQEFAIFLGPPASAALLFVASGLGIPHLVGTGRMSFPLNLTLPVVFALLIRVSVILWASPSSAVFRTFDPLMPALSWSRVALLAVSAMVQCIVLSAFVIAGNR